MDKEQKHSHTKLSDKYKALIELDAKETILCAITKHPVGLWFIYTTGFFIAAVVFVATFLTSVFAVDNIAGTFLELTIPIAGVLLTVLVLFFTYVSGFIYQHNIIVVTSDKVAQILYQNLIDRKVSQLSLGEIQDVTVTQKGLLARIFGYGTLVIETAGEQDNYNFTFTPSPHAFAKDIITAHEQSIQKYGN